MINQVLYFGDDYADFSTLISLEFIFYYLWTKP